MNDLKAGLKRLADHVSELETEARKLENKNFADIIGSAKAKLLQASEHPDTAAVAALLSSDHEASQAGGQIMDPVHSNPFPGAGGEQKEAS